MPIDVQKERTLPLGKARGLPWLKGRGGEPISVHSLRRWSLHGLRGVVLETVRMGGTTYTSTEAILRFLASLNETDARPTQVRPDQHRISRKKKLDDAGI